MGSGVEYRTRQEAKQDFVTVDNSPLQLASNCSVNVTALGIEKNWVALCALPIVAFVAVGNVLVILAVKKDYKLRSSTNYFLTSLAAADLLVAITVMPPSLAMIVNNFEWPFPESMCGIWQMLDVCFSTASILHLCMISLDRYLALAKPFRYSGGGLMPKNHSSSGGWATDRRGNSRWRMGSGLGGGSGKLTKRVAKRIIAVWAISLGMALPLPILGYKDRNNIFIGKTCVINKPEFTVYGSLGAFFLPLVVMFVTYSLTIRTLQRQSKLVQCIMGKDGSSTHRGRQSMTSSSSKYSLKSMTFGSGKRILGKRISFGVSDGNASLPDIPFAAGNGHKRAHSTFDGVSFKNSQAESKIKTCARMCCACFGSKENELRKLESELMQSEFDVRARSALQKSESDNSESSSMLNQPVGIGRSPMLARANTTFSKVVSKLPLNRLSTRRISATVKSRAIATEQRASKVLGLIFTLFCLFWCPFFITNFVNGICELYHLDQCNFGLMGNLMNWFVWVGYTSSGVNPCVYTLFSRQFRETFRKLVCCRCSEIGQREFHRTFKGDGTAGFSTSSFHQDTTYKIDAFRSDADPKTTMSVRSASDAPHMTLGEGIIVRQNKRNRVTQSVDTVTLSNGRDDRSPTSDSQTQKSLQWRSTWHYRLDKGENGERDSPHVGKARGRKESKVTFCDVIISEGSDRRRRRLFSDPNTYVTESLLLKDSIAEGEGDCEDTKLPGKRRYSSMPRRRQQSPGSAVPFVDFRRARFHCGSDSSLEQNDSNNNFNDVFVDDSPEHESFGLSPASEAKESHSTPVRCSPEPLRTKRDAEARQASSLSLSISWRHRGDEAFRSRRESREYCHPSHDVNARTTAESGEHLCRHQLPGLSEGAD